VDAPPSVQRAVFALVGVTVATGLWIWTNPETWLAGARMTLWLWALFIAVNGAFIWLLFLAWRRRNWARLTVVAWCVLGWVALALSFRLTNASLSDRTFRVLAVLVEIGACQQLLSKAASTWYRASLDA